MTPHDSEFQLLLHHLETLHAVQGTDCLDVLDRLESQVRSRFNQTTATLNELAAAAPRWEHDALVLQAGQKTLLIDLQALKAAAADIDRRHEFWALCSRWLSHFRVHEHLENRLIQLSFLADVGGEGG